MIGIEYTLTVNIQFTKCIWADYRAGWFAQFKLQTMIYGQSSDRFVPIIDLESRSIKHILRESNVAMETGYPLVN